MLEPHLINSCQFSKCLSNKLLDMTSCSHHKIFVASLNSIDNPAEKKKRLREAKLISFLPNAADVVLRQCTVKVYL